MYLLLLPYLVSESCPQKFPCKILLANQPEEPAPEFFGAGNQPILLNYLLL